MYSFAGLFILFLSCVIFQFYHSLLNHVSLLPSFLSFALSTFPFLPHYLFPMSLHQTSLSSLVKALDLPTKHRLVQFTAGSRVVCICVCLMCCRVESSKSPRTGPETAAPPHLNLLNLNVPLRFPLQTWYSCIFCICVFQCYWMYITFTFIESF